jgi:peptidoglycan/xylan/chitin deacetylase (PgdA/CDA1 family)
MRYVVTSPWWLRLLFPSGMTWHMPRNEKKIYLTFDDGPHPTATPFVLDCLRSFKARATFFCIGKNIDAYPEIYKRILEEGHATGNHTQSHLNARKVRHESWVADVGEAKQRIVSDLFRPPYGQITRKGAKALQNFKSPHRIVMWDVLSGDFDEGISGEQCIRHVTENAKAGSIVVFHDSTKAWPRLEVALPAILAHYSKRGYKFEAIR